MKEKNYYFTEPGPIIDNKRETYIIYSMNKEEIMYYHFFRLENDNIKSILRRNNCSIGIIIKNIDSLEKRAILINSQDKYNKDTEIEIINYLKSNNIFDIEFIENIDEILINNKCKIKQYIK